MYWSITKKDANATAQDTIKPVQTQQIRLISTQKIRM